MVENHQSFSGRAQDETVALRWNTVNSLVFGRLKGAEHMNPLFVGLRQS